MSEDEHILEGAGLGPRQNTALQDLIDKVCMYLVSCQVWADDLGR
jgi:hypothetical protein